MSSLSSLTKPSNSIQFSAKHSSYEPKPSNVSSSTFKHESSKPSNFSTATVKPSFFSSGLEAFSKHSIYRKSTLFNKLKGLKNIAAFDVTNYDCNSALENYKKWLKIHKQQQGNLCLKLKRPPQCMAMNKTSNTLYTNQEKHLITEASNYNYYDEQRGHPNFWKPDNAAENNKNRFGVYQAIEQKYDRSRKNYWLKPKQREYVGIPDEIYKERGLSREKCLMTSQQQWDNSEYVKKRTEQLKDKLKVVQEHKPKLSEIIVIGRGIGKTEEPSFNFSPERRLSRKSVTISSEGFDPVLCRKGFKTTFTVGEKAIKDNLPEVITVEFENCFINERYEKSIKIKNADDHSALKFFFQIIIPNWAKDDMYLPLKYVKSKSKCFYFDKIPAAVHPGEEKSVVFYFKSSYVGVFTETWELVISDAPDIWESIVLELRAVAIEPLDSTQTLSDIDSYLESCTKLTMARKTIKNVLDRVRPEKIEDLPYGWKYFEEQLFVYNNPDLFYDNKCVSILKMLHEKYNRGPWDYSVKCLRETLISKASNANTTEDLQLFTSMVYKLMRPQKTVSIFNEKHKYAYEFLCSFVSKMEYEGTNLKLTFGIPLNFQFSGDFEDDLDMINKVSTTSTKLTTRASNVSKKTTENSLQKTKSSIGKIVLPPEVSKSIAYSETKIGDSIDSSITCENFPEKRKQEFLEALYIKTYHHLCKTIEQIAAVIDSFDNNTQKTVLNSLKELNF